MGGAASSKPKKRQSSVVYELGNGKNEVGSGKNSLVLKDEIRDRVAAIAERNAALRASDAPKLSSMELGKLKNKERILEEMRLETATLELATTFSMTVKWELLYRGAEKQIEFFVVEVMPLEDGDAQLDVWSSLESSPEEKVEYACSVGQWTQVPHEVVDHTKRSVYIGGLTSQSPPLAFRVRGRHSVGWGSWSIPSQPFKTLDNKIPPPQLRFTPEEPLRLDASWGMNETTKTFGQLLYYKVFLRIAKSETRLESPFFKSKKDVEVYCGRETSCSLGCKINSILAQRSRTVRDLIMPGSTYEVRVECAMGLSRGDKRYNSYYHSDVMEFPVPKVSPAKMGPVKEISTSSVSISLSWEAPICDGGEKILTFKLFGREEGSDPDSSVVFYDGMEETCTLGEGAGTGVTASGLLLSPGTRYLFKVAAVNSIGIGVPSDEICIQTKTIEEEEQERQNNLERELAQLATEMDNVAYEYEDELMASPDGFVDLPEGWKEYWDPRSEELFYYNVYSGQNQWEHPGQSGEGQLLGLGMTVQEESDEMRLWRVFRKKRFRFLHELRHLYKETKAHVSSDPLRLSVRREQLVSDTVVRLMRVDAWELCRKLHVIYQGESGIDSGGLSKDWFLEFSNQMLQADYCLFRCTEGGKYVIDPRSKHQPESLSYYTCFGRVCGKALFDQQLIHAPFSSAVMKQVLGQKPDLDDLREVDPILAKSLTWMLENDITDILDESFSITVEEFGSFVEVPLRENGQDIPVTESNKAEYVEAVLHWHFTESVKDQVGALLHGIWEVIPASTIQRFSTGELSLLLNGKPEINIDELQHGCVKYTGGYEEASPTVQLFWQVMRELTHEERANVIRFATGCDKLPLDGFPPFLPFTITKSEFGPEGLPTAHTCFNQLVLPPYQSGQDMRSKLLMACDHGIGFEMT